MVTKGKSIEKPLNESKTIYTSTEAKKKIQNTNARGRHLIQTLRLRTN